ncbi:hypothetical protein [Vibrio phage RYC]|nr:hypothetical protein [Vibrio phage RYC]
MQRCNIPHMNEEQRNWLSGQTGDLNIIFKCFHGSHLYGLDREGSDIDIKAVYLPTKTDLLYGNSLKTFNLKNDKLDIEIEIKSLPSFIKSCASVDTNCVDLLNAPDYMVLKSSPLWNVIRQHKDTLYSKTMKGMVGYIKTHAAKYSHKIERVKEMQSVLDLASSWGEDVRIEVLGDYDWSGFKYVKPVKIVQDHEQQYLEVCGKKYIFTNQMPILVAAMERELTRYGSRTAEGVKKGMDTKSLSHAARVLCEIDQIIDEGGVTFPLRDVDYLKKIKMNEVSYQEVMDFLDDKFEEVMNKLENSNLPDETDISRLTDIVVKHYFTGG